MTDFVKQLRDLEYIDPKMLPLDRWAGILPYIYTAGIVVGFVRNGALQFDQRWCYETVADAKKALDAWDGVGEPQGWHRHIPSGRRRPDGDPNREYINP
jgi:hypothetical protein